MTKQKFHFLIFYTLWNSNFWNSVYPKIQFFEFLDTLKFVFLTLQNLLGHPVKLASANCLILIVTPAWNKWSKNNGWFFGSFEGIFWLGLNVKLQNDCTVWNPFLVSKILQQRSQKSIGSRTAFFLEKRLQNAFWYSFAVAKVDKKCSKMRVK